jgi:hypothetical protein
MRHSSWLLTTLALALSLSACGDDKTTATPTPMPSASTVKPASKLERATDLPRPPGTSLPSDLRPPK